MKLLLIAFLLVGCIPSQQSDFDKWYEAVINEPYDPVNGSKY